MTATIALWALTAILIAHIVVFRAATRWTRNAWRVDVYDREAWTARTSLGIPTVTPPWYVRYADWLGRVARRPRVTGQVVVHLDIVIPKPFRQATSAASAHVPPPAVDVARHYNHMHWAMTGDGELRPVPLDGGIHPALYDAGGHLPFGEHRVQNTSDRPEPVITEDALTAQRSRPTPTPEQVQRAFEAFSGSFAEAVARMSAALMETFKRVDVLMRDLDPIYDHRRRRDERLAAKRPEQTALWTAYRHKTRRRNRRRRNR